VEAVVKGLARLRVVVAPLLVVDPHHVADLAAPATVNMVNVIAAATARYARLLLVLTVMEVPKTADVVQDLAPPSAQDATMETVVIVDAEARQSGMMTRLMAALESLGDGEMVDLVL
jgi:hypothetical protein